MLRSLKAAGVSIAFGSDSYDVTSEAEARTIGALGLFSPLEALRMWSVVTTTMIFPTRKEQPWPSPAGAIRGHKAGSFGSEGSTS